MNALKDTEGILRPIVLQETEGDVQQGPWRLHSTEASKSAPHLSKKARMCLPALTPNLCRCPSLLAHSCVAASRSSSMALKCSQFAQLFNFGAPCCKHSNMIRAKKQNFPVKLWLPTASVSHATEPAPPHQPLQPSDLWPAKDGC